MLTLAAVALLGSAPWTCDREDARIRRHLADALTQLRTTTPSGLTGAQRVARTEVIALLDAYAAEGRFPRRQGTPSPVFVDEAGAHCAMGALLAGTGASALVERIRLARNLETVGTLANEPGLAEWLVAHGMTAEEAALVQPTYYRCVPPLFHCAGGTGGWLVVTPLAADGGHTPFLFAESSGMQCRGEPYTSLGGAWTGEEYRPWVEGAPVGSIFSERLGTFATQDGELPLSVAPCSAPVVLTPSLLAAPDRQTCMKRAIQSDLRWLIPTCSTHRSAEDSLACHPEGRRRSGLLPRRGTLQAVVEAELGAGFFQDAGITPAMFAAAEALAWDESDDGGVARSPADRSRYLRWIPGGDPQCVAARDAGVDAGAPARPDAGYDGGVAADAGVPAPTARDAGDDAGPAIEAPLELPRLTSGSGPVASGCTSTGVSGGLLLVLLVVSRLNRRST
ncbi:MAG: hypothetical protein JNJ54_15525 [Myxococcaceae bacterium]|nr:hypothetical protein [Myxococcaceae bacterium]